MAVQEDGSPRRWQSKEMAVQEDGSPRRGLSENMTDEDDRYSDEDDRGITFGGRNLQYNFFKIICRINSV